MKVRIIAVLAVTGILNISVFWMLFSGSEHERERETNVKHSEPMHRPADVPEDGDSSHALMDHDAALHSLARSAVEGDSRSPRLLKSSMPRRRGPSDAVLADPIAYERRQKEARVSTARRFTAAAEKRLAKMREEIRAAERDGRRSERDMRRAREALRELEKARAYLRGFKKES